MEAWAVGGRRSGRGGEGDPHGRQRATGLLPRRTCIHEVLRLAGAAAGTAGVGSQAKAEEAGRLSATSGRGCCCGSDFWMCLGVLGRHPRWGVVGWPSAALGHGGCVMFATDLTGRWRAAGRVGRCCADQ